MTTENVEQTQVEQAQPAPEASGIAASLQAKQEETKATKPVVEYRETGNMALDGALRILGRAGIAEDSFEMDRAREGDFGPLKAILKHLGAEDGDIALQLMEHAYNEHVSLRESAEAQLQKDLISIAGGEEEWDATLKFIDENATEAESEELVEALSAGGVAAKMAAKYMTALYQHFGQSATGEEPAAQEQAYTSPRATAARAGSGSQDYISSDDFYQQFQTLVNQGVPMNDPRIQRLQATRLRSIKADGY